MTRYIYIFLFAALLTACSQPQASSGNDDITTVADNDVVTDPGNLLKDKHARFLWRENLYNEELKDTFSTIVINEELSQSLSEPERAALGFVATFIGSECKWDGDYKEDRSNLKCKALMALHLGYQCSDEHLGFLRKWFRNDTSSLKELENCPTVPYTASRQQAFDFIDLTVKGDTIVVAFSASGVHMPVGESWSWKEEDHFLFSAGHIQLVSRNKSEVSHQHFDTGE